MSVDRRAAWRTRWGAGAKNAEIVALAARYGGVGETSMRGRGGRRGREAVGRQIGGGGVVRWRRGEASLGCRRRQRRGCWRRSRRPPHCGGWLALVTTDRKRAPTRSHGYRWRSSKGLEKSARSREAAAITSGVADPFFRVHEGIAGAETVIDGNRPYVNFASYNYVGLNGDPRDRRRRPRRRSTATAPRVSASRPVSGERPVHRELELALARGCTAPKTCVALCRRPLDQRHGDRAPARAQRS